MSESLISLVAYLMGKSMRKDPELLQELRARTRYCKLLALRLGLPPRQVDAVVLAAWLSGNGFGKELLEHMVTPYPLEDILRMDGQGQGTGRIEALILKLVTTYHKVQKSAPEVCGDVHHLRRRLDPNPANPQEEAVLEAFLHLLRDERFLGKIDSVTRRILIVDPDESGDPTVVLRLNNDGYDVKTAPNVREAAKMIVNAQVDLIVSEVDLPGTDGLRFCRALKEKKDTAHIPFIFVTGNEGERIAAACLEAGAEDFFKKPADPELLSLKITRLFSSQKSSEKKPGVHGTLTEMGFTDIIQSLTSGDKDVQILLDTGGKKGQVYIQGGEVIHAVAADTEGEDAFYEIMAWQEADFQIIPCNNFPARTIHVPAMSLLMEGARLTDEVGDPGEDE